VLNKSNSFIYLLILITTFIGCARDTKKLPTDNLIVIDSLGWQDDADYGFSTINIHRIFEDEIFLLDLDNLKFLVYNTNNFEYKRSFGNRGKGPSELYFPTSFTITENGEIVVSDLGNAKIVWFDRNGKYLKSLQFSNPGNISFSENRLLISNYFLSEPYKLYEYSEDSNFEEIADLTSMCKELEITDMNKRECYAYSIDNSLVFNFPDFSGKTVLKKGNHLEKICDYNLLNTGIFESSTNITSFNNKYYILKNSFMTQNTKVKEGKEKGLIHEFILEFDTEGKITKLYGLPSNIFKLKGESLNIINNTFFFQNVLNGQIMKLGIVNMERSKI
jgi:hypothetical protein